LPSQKRILEKARKQLGMGEPDVPPGTRPVYVTDVKGLTWRSCIDADGKNVDGPTLVPMTQTDEEDLVLNAARGLVKREQVDLMSALESLRNYPGFFLDRTHRSHLNVSLVVDRLLKRLAERGTVETTLTSDKA
jgi:hypothetical protein